MMGHDDPHSGCKLISREITDFMLNQQKFLPPKIFKVYGKYTYNLFLYLVV